MIQVDRLQFINLCKSCGFHNASGWLVKGDDFLLRQITELFSDVEDITEGPADEEFKPLFLQLVEGVKNSEEIELIGDKPVTNSESNHKPVKESEGEDVSKKKEVDKEVEPKKKPNKEVKETKTAPDGEKAEPKKRGRKPNPDKPPKEKKPPMEKDKFGNRIGSKKAKFNTAFTRKPQTVKELAAAAGLEMAGQWMYNHLHDLDRMKLVSREGNSYLLPPKEKKED